MKFKKSFLLLGVVAVSILPITTIACSWGILGSKSSGAELYVENNNLKYGKLNTQDMSYNIKINARWLSTPAVPARDPHFQDVIWEYSNNIKGAFWQEGKKASSNFADFTTKAKTSGFSNSAIGVIPYLYTYSFNIKVNKNNPYLTLATKFSPSPDWFGGFSALNLFNGGWLTSYYHSMYIYSAAVKDQRFSDAGIIVKNKQMNVGPRDNHKPFGTIDIKPI